MTTWASAGANAVIDSLLIINVSSIPDSMCVENTNIPIPEAQSGEGFDNSLTFNELIKWINSNVDSVLVHTQINIPPGIYNFSDQIIMHPNISLKGEGSHLTELRFLIRADSTSTTMSETDCRKDAILVSGIDDYPKYNIGIEDLKITREDGGLTPRVIKERVGDYSYKGTLYPSYWGNNIALRRATDCWVKGVESENTFRNHVTLEFSNHITISGVYFNDAYNHGNGGYGYGVGIWDSSNNKVENSIFKRLRHGVTISDRSWFNVIAYNYFRDQYSVAELPFSTIILPFPDEIEQKWSDIAIHGEPDNTYYYEQGNHSEINPLNRPTYNLIEGNNLEYLCVDATHMYNGQKNTFLRNGVLNQIHVMGYDGFPEGFTESLIACNIVVQAASTLNGLSYGGPVGGALGWDLGFYVSYGLSYVAMQFVCKDCASLRMADQFTYLIPNGVIVIDSVDIGADKFRFQNQPRQLFVNNYARDYHWWRNQILDHPVRIHSETAQYQKNTYKRYYNWWGTKKGKTIGQSIEADNDKSYYQENQDNQPNFWPQGEAWPYVPCAIGTDDEIRNPAKKRYAFGGKKTVGEDDEASGCIFRSKRATRSAS